MPNNTVPVELVNILNNYIKPYYPAANIDNYYDPLTLLPKTPSGTPDRLAQHLVELVLNVRNASIYGYAAPMSDLEIEDLYADLIRHLDAAVAVLTVIQGVIDTASGSLP